jgi:hypothetical protein
MAIRLKFGYATQRIAAGGIDASTQGSADRRGFSDGRGEAPSHTGPRRA